MTKRIFILFIVFYIVIIDLYSGEWIVVDSAAPPSNQPFNAIDCYDKNNCIAVGRTNYLSTTHFRYSINDIYKWKSFIGDEEVRGRKVEYLSPSFCIVTADSGYYYISRDTLKTWKRVILDTTWYVNIVDSSLARLNNDDIFFLNEKFGCIENINTLFITIDGTQNWITISPEQMNSGLPDSLKTKWIENVFITSNGKIHILGSSIHYKSSIDTGRFWKSYIMPKREMRSLYFIDSMRGWVCGGRQKAQYSNDNWSTILYTSDGGATWEVQLDTLLWPNDPLMRIKFWDENTGISLGYRSTLWITTNGGKDWIRDGTFRKVGPGAADLSDFEFLNKDKIIAVTGGLGASHTLIYDYLTSTFADESDNQNERILVYPNPAAERLLIKLGVRSLKSNYAEATMDRLGVVEVVVYNVLCQPILDYKLQISNYELQTEVDVSSLLPGMYYIVVNAGGEVVTKQFAVVR